MRRKQMLRSAKALSVFIPGYDPEDLLDMVYVLVEERSDLVEAREALIAFIDQATPFTGTAEAVADLLTPMAVDLVLKHLATPEQRASWFQARKDAIQQMRKNWQQRKVERGG